MARRGDSDASGGGWVRVIDESHLVVESEIARGSFGVMMKATMNGTQSVALKVRPATERALLGACVIVHVYTTDCLCACVFVRVCMDGCVCMGGWVCVHD